MTQVFRAALLAVTATFLSAAALAAGVFALFALAFKPESIQRSGA